MASYILEYSEYLVRIAACMHMHPSPKGWSWMDLSQELRLKFYTVDLALARNMLACPIDNLYSSMVVTTI